MKTKKYVWLSDTHLNMSLLPFMKRRFIGKLKSIESDGLILTGDISNGLMLESDLKYLSDHYDGPIYFVLGNHDYYWRHGDSVESDVRRLCSKHRNLVWLSDVDFVPISKDAALVGDEGWYDAAVGDPGLTWWNVDRLINLDFFSIPTHIQQVCEWRERSKKSSLKLARKIRSALEEYETVYVATHFPPWPEATRSDWKVVKDFWLPYNTNVTLGQEIEKIMKDRSEKVVVLSGHTHLACELSVSKNITCKVAPASYLGKVGPEELIIL